MANRKKNKSEGRISESSQKLEGKYANYFEIGHNPYEFVFDFGQFHAEKEKDFEIYIRMYINPAIAKELFEVLRKSIEKFENRFGVIKQVNQ